MEQTQITIKKNSNITPHQAVLSLVLFNFGSSVIMGINTKVNQDAWIAILLATLIAVPLFLIYARILKLFPKKDIFEISDLLFGKWGSKAIAILFTWYALFLAALVLRNFSEFTEITSMPETPQLPIMILMILTTIYLARSDMRAIGKWSVIMVFLVLLVVLLTFSASMQQMRLDDILPIFEHPPEQIAQTTFQIFSFPYAETVMFLGVANSFKKDGRPYKMLFYGLILIFIIFLLVFLRNLSLLGRTMMALSFFPSYVTARIIEIGDFIARIEGSISSNFLLAGIVKISIILMVAAKGLTKMFNLKNYRTMVLPAGMIVLALCAILYENTMQMYAFIDYYAYYAFPFQVIIPLAILIAGEIHTRKQKNRTKKPAKPAAKTSGATG
ncbi:MAG: GerAB/ArcD/ProY family transporter [Christensenellales bacterium]|jgi:spore germination protein KB